MKTLEQQMSVYAAYHRNPKNKLTHFIGVPLIVFGVMQAMSWVRVDLGSLELTLAMLTTAWVLGYYLMLDLALGGVMIVIMGALLYAANEVAHLGLAINAVVFAVAFGGGWVIQLIGHVYEGRKPALVDNLFQVFVAPIFLAAETVFAIGMKRGLHDRVQAMSHQYDIAAVPPQVPHSTLSAD
jgi:uncharacterized membrane protein YGL010W